MRPKCLGDVCVRCALREYTDHLLPLFDRVLDLPVHPVTLCSVVSDEHYERTRPVNAWLEVLLLDIVWVVCVIGLVTVDRPVAHIHASLGDEILQLR